MTLAHRFAPEGNLLVSRSTAADVEYGMQRRHFDESEYPDKELTREIIGAFYYVYHRFGYGFLESVYRKALVVELRYRGIPVQEEVPCQLDHRGVIVGTPRADVLAYGRIIVETKTGTVLDPKDPAQLQNYLSAFKLQLGLMLHFGPTPTVKRLIATRYHLTDCSSDQLRALEKGRLKADSQ
jgi:GxxExxY protein